MIESFSWKIPFSNIRIGFHNKTLKFYRTITVIAICVFLLFWVYTGYEGTVIRLFPDKELQELPQGVGIHFGTIIFTLASFLIISHYSEKVGIDGLRNVLFSFIISTGLINGIFEVQYSLLYDIIHHQAFWINAPFLYTTMGIFRLYPTYRNWYWLIAGLLLIYLIKNNYKNVDWVWKIKHRVTKAGGIGFSGFHEITEFVHNKWVWIGSLLISSWLLWILFPFPFVQVRANLFPQYIYGFMEHEIIPDIIAPENIITLLETNWKCVYLENTGVRIINEITKILHFAFFTALFLPRRKLGKLSHQVKKRLQENVKDLWI